MGKKKKDKKKDKKKKKDSKKKKKKDKKDKDKKKKKKKDKTNANREAVSNQFGKYGVIKGEDFFNKKPEFLCWASEVKKENTDEMGQMKMRELFKEFIEDYNTATMPNKKYYNLNAWDQKRNNIRAKRMKGQEQEQAQRASLASFDDERARKEEIKTLQAKKESDALSSELGKLRMDKQKAEAMQQQERLRAQRDLLNKAGHSEKAAELNNRLRPGEDTRKKGYEPSAS